jgi:uncharacterized membrane protein
MPDYSLLKILHTVAATLVVIGILLSATAVAKPPPASRLAALRKWDLFVTAPALVILWILGVILAINGHWFPSIWLPVKLVFVLALSALHGMQAGALKRLERGQPPLPSCGSPPIWSSLASRRSWYWSKPSHSETLQECISSAPSLPASSDSSPP